jgi:putative spermidine/putrescine transport system ATP-binding protein
MSKVKLRLDGICKSYGAQIALHRTALEVGDGEFLTLLGPSGSGQTTLLHCVAGLIEPDGGRIEIGGVDATRVEPSKRDIGMVFQNYALFPHLTVFENIAFPLRMRRASESEVTKRVRAALSLVQLSQVEQRFPRQLSGGQQQRIAHARCVVYEPAIVLMDEPLGALDKKLREQMQHEIKRIHRALGTTILYVTHDQDEAMTMSDRICLMRDGRIEQLGTPHSLYHAPDSVYAADFLGESNLLKGRYRGNGSFVAGSGAEVELRGEPAASLPADSEAWCLVRPESIRLLREGHAADNALDAIVVDATLAGGITRYRLESAGGTELLATVLSSGDDARMQPGSPIRIGIAASDVKFLAR